MLVLTKTVTPLFETIWANQAENFKLTMIFALAEELREVLDKKVDVFEIHEINQESEFYNTIMKERLLVA